MKDQEGWKGSANILNQTNEMKKRKWAMVPMKQAILRGGLASKIGKLQNTKPMMSHVLF